MGLLQSGSAWLSSLSEQAAGQPVTISRGGTSVTTTAVVGKTDFQTIDDRGVVTSFEARDYLVMAANLGTLGAPQAGDKFTDAGFVYTVMPPPGQPAWRWWGRWRSRYRVHCKYTGAAS